MGSGHMVDQQWTILITIMVNIHHHATDEDYIFIASSNHG